MGAALTLLLGGLGRMRGDGIVLAWVDESRAGRRALTISKANSAGTSVERVRLIVRGAVQGVGFRPFVYRLAGELAVRGFVRNSAEGAWIEAEAESDGAVLGQFVSRLRSELPPRSFITSLELSHLPPLGFADFRIEESSSASPSVAVVLPDLATCPDCVRELFDPRNRRHRYPFINCTQCGPRYSIVEAMPYDRARTTMKGFVLCPECLAEYGDPTDRRFHAQPNACPVCGPRLRLLDRRGDLMETGEQALACAVTLLKQSGILAVKGLGGFQLLVRAADERSVARLRELKHREEKPFAVMVPGLSHAMELCDLNEIERGVLTSPEAPILVALRRKVGTGEQAGAGVGVGAVVAEGVAPGNPRLGVFLPTTALHHLILHDLGECVVATSGNLADEPICIDDTEALDRLGGIADGFLTHDRPILRHVDDSVVAVVLGREMVLRRARGFAPLPVPVNADVSGILAVGAHLKNTVALGRGREVFLSQHIGDLEGLPARNASQRVMSDLGRLLQTDVKRAACDMHPDYGSTRHAESLRLPMVRVQHHFAHVLACASENELLRPPLLGVSWDGSGYGTDGTVWGGEFFQWTESEATRVGHFGCFRLPGGELAVKEGRRAAAGLLFELFGEAWMESPLVRTRGIATREEARVWTGMMRKGLNAPLCSSVGRLFDAVAALTGVAGRSNYEGQAAMRLEWALSGERGDEAYAWELEPTRSVPGGGDGAVPTMLRVRWEPGLRQLLADVESGVPVGVISARFHHMLAGSVLDVARAVGLENIVLTGGCFQNRYLLERVVGLLRGAGFRPFWHQRVPPNDGGIALGQVVAATLDLKTDLITCA